MNRYEHGKVLNILKMNEPMKGAAVTEQFNDRAVIYSLGKGTDIEAESFHQYHFLFVAMGKIECYALNERGIQKRWNIRQGAMTMLPLDMPVGVNALEDSVYARISAVRKEDVYPQLEIGQEYLLNDLVPYRDHEISKARILFNEQMQISVLAMDQNCSFETTADAVSGIAVTDGTVDLMYEGAVSPVHEGQIMIVEKGKEIRLHASYGRTHLTVIKNYL